MKGIKITGYIEPVSLLDSYPTHLDNFGKGGVHSVASLLEREAIFLERRSLGMLAFDTGESSMYGLFGGLDNTGWVKLFDYKDNKLNFNIFCDTNYILLGDENNIAKPSPILIDVRQDIIDLKRQIGHFETLSYHKIWIGNELNNPQETLQISTINLPTLGAAVFPLPDLVSNLILDIPIPNPTFNPLSLSDWIMSGPWLPQIFAGSVNILNTSSETKVSSSLAMTQIRTAKNFKLFDNASFIVANKEVSFLWDNPAYWISNLDPNLSAIINLYNLGSSYTFTKAQSLGDLETGLLKNTVDLGSGVLSKAEPGVDYLPGINEPPLPDESNVLLYANQKVYSSPITYIVGGESGILNFKGGTITALNFAAKRYQDQNASISVEGNIYAVETIGARRLILYDSKEIAHSREDGVTLEGPPDLPVGTMLKWLMPSAISTTNQALVDIGPNGVLLNERLLGFVDMPPADAKYIIQSANDRLPNAQVLSELDDGFMYNTTGVISTILQPPLPSLAENKLWIGDNSDKAIETQTINLENLPPLHQTIVPNPTTLDLVGQVYEGTVSGVPKVSNIVGEIFGDVALINLRFASAKFVLNDGNIALQTLMPSSQFLSNVTSGLPIQISTNLSTPGKIEVAELPYNYLWVGDAQGRVSSQPNIILSNLPDLTNGKIWKGDVNNRPFESDANYAPNDAKYIIQSENDQLPNAQALSSIAGILGGILKCDSSGVVSIASGGSIPVVNDYVTPLNLLAEKQEREGFDEVLETEIAALEAEVEAEIAALAGVVAISDLIGILGFVFTTIGGYEYGQYIRGQSLNVKSSWKETDLNDESHNAVGDFEIRYPSGYSSDSRGKGTLWFDSNGRDLDNRDSKAEGGLRIFSWDSGGDRIGFDSPLAPVHIGIFGYQNRRENIPLLPNRTPTYKGFIFSCDFDNAKTISDTGIIFEDDNPNYRFPLKFGLYDAKRTISSSSWSWEGEKQNWGFSEKIPIFEYDYNNFNFYKDVKFESTGAVKIPVGANLERPLSAEVGMIRYNKEL